MPQPLQSKAKKEENEVKIAAPDVATVRALLRRSRFRITHRRVFEQNTVLDDPHAKLKSNGLLLRVRTAGASVTVTFKGPALKGLHKRREEREFHSDNLEECLAVFDRIGYARAFRYEKYRTEFARQGEPGHITLDETPIGVFLELEGPARWLDRTAKELGYSRADYITESYLTLFAKWCEEFDIDSRDMHFEAHGPRSAAVP